MDAPNELSAWQQEKLWQIYSQLCINRGVGNSGECFEDALRVVLDYAKYRNTLLSLTRSHDTEKTFGII